MRRFFSGMLWPWLPRVEIILRDALQMRAKSNNRLGGAEQQSMIAQQ
jgi:hypothetical protein